MSNLHLLPQPEPVTWPKLLSDGLTTLTISAGNMLTAIESAMTHGHLDAASVLAALGTNLDEIGDVEPSWVLRRWVMRIATLGLVELPS